MLYIYSLIFLLEGKIDLRFKRENEDLRGEKRPLAFFPLGLGQKMTRGVFWKRLKLKV
jgi:hypothetical protein